ncbi:Ger(x)C family spore germination C-terminal domain-containing protein [Paenibacillus harenae]|uniref:Ger(x)C family spore germination C-terminal domain-containing protein n=1 Tax=Paenibacillus harenae TaxID=306543 RepID=UPI0004003BD3|nr:Ger(x)C family spore germination C-terminal domain-containing protein [Paenibacillus harenae]
MLKVKPLSDRYPGNTLFLSFGADGTESSYTYVETLSDLSRRSMEEGLDPVIPVIMKDNKEGFIINRASLLNKEKVKLVLSPSESQMYIQLADEIVKSSTHGTVKGHPIVLTINQMNTKYRIGKQNGYDVITMRVKMNTVVEEAPNGMYTQNWAPIEQRLNKTYSKSAEKLLRKIQKAGVDPLGFGLRYRAAHPGKGAWKEWQSIYPYVKFIVNTDIKIEGTGLIK